MSGRKKKKQRSQPVPEIEGPALTPAASSSPPSPHRWTPRGCPLIALPDVSWGSPTLERVQVSEPVWGRGGQMISNQPCAPRALPRGQEPGGPSPLSSRHVLSARSQGRAQRRGLGLRTFPLGNCPLGPTSRVPRGTKGPAQGLGVKLRRTPSGPELPTPARVSTVPSHPHAWPSTRVMSTDRSLWREHPQALGQR